MYLCSSLFRFCDKNKSNEKGRIPSEEADLNFRDAKKFYRTPIIFILFASAGDGGERVKPEGLLVFLHLGPGLLYQSGGWLIADIF